MSAVISFKEVVKHFYKDGKPVVALDGVSFDVTPGEFVAVVGPSGCGKSTLLNLVSGLMLPTDGGVLYCGKPVNSVNTGVGYLTQKDTLMPWRSVESNISLALEMRKSTGIDRKAAVAGFVNRFGLTGFEHHFPSELSGGMRKRVALARTMIYNPETLLMDEPFGALDAQLKLIMHDDLLKVCEKSGKTTVFVTHDLVEAITLADRVVVMTARPGRVKTVQEIPLPRPRDVFKIRFKPEFGTLFEELWNILSEDIHKGQDV